MGHIVTASGKSLLTANGKRIAVEGPPYHIPIQSLGTLKLRNFRAFRGPDKDKFHEFNFEGKNVLVYGENGSGKTSLWAALDLFLGSVTAKDEPASRKSFAKHRYQFNRDEGEVRAEFIGPDDTPFRDLVWSREFSPFQTEELLSCARVSARLDYRALWETYFLHSKRNQVDIWPLLIDVLLPHVSTISGPTFSEMWGQIKTHVADPSSDYWVPDDLRKVFHPELKAALDNIKKESQEILDVLSPGLVFDFAVTDSRWLSLGPRILGNLRTRLRPPQVILTILINNQPLKNHHNLLNEARLSALALSIYLAAAKINAAQARSGFKILALDDVLIGLDMSNRLPVLEVLETYFSDWQIFLFTYDRAWYELAAHQLGNVRWKHFEFFASDTLPIWDEDLGLIAKSKAYLQPTRTDAHTRQTVNCTPDYRAAGAYARAAFEKLIKETCDKKKIPLPYKMAGDYMIGDMWPNFQKLEMIDKNDPQGNWTPLFPPAFLQEVQDCLDNHYNPLCHTQIRQVHKGEVAKAVDVLERLQNRVNDARKLRLPTN